MLASEVAVVKSHHGISVKCSRYRDTGPTDPSLVMTQAFQLEVNRTVDGFYHMKVELIYHVHNVLLHNGIITKFVNPLRYQHC